MRGVDTTDLRYSDKLFSMVQNGPILYRKSPVELHLFFRRQSIDCRVVIYLLSIKISIKAQSLDSLIKSDHKNTTVSLE